MTNPLLVSRHTAFISPFLLPYIRADEEDMAKQRDAKQRRSHDTHVIPAARNQSPDNKPAEIPKSESYSTAPTSPHNVTGRKVSYTPPSRGSVESVDIRNTSAIEHSLHSINVDPELSFAYSPGRSSAFSDDSPMKRDPATDLSVERDFFSPTRTLSPDRSLLTIGEPEINKDELSDGITTKVALSEELTGEQAPKRRKIIQESSHSRRTAGKSEASEPGSRSRRKETISAESALTTVPSHEHQKKEPLRKDTPESAPATLSTRKRRTNGDQTVTKVPSMSEKLSKTSTKSKPISKQVDDTPRKSPRFASKVITSKVEVPPVMVCSVCGKAYKRSRDYEKHISSCK
jgi:hypothetical protein